MWSEEDEEEWKCSGIRVTAEMPAKAPASLYPPKAVHQCAVCNKIFVSFKGLQQHAVLHTDQVCRSLSLTLLWC